MNVTAYSLQIRVCCGLYQNIFSDLRKSLATDIQTSAPLFIKSIYLGSSDPKYGYFRLKLKIYFCCTITILYTFFTIVDKIFEKVKRYHSYTISLHNSQTAAALNSCITTSLSVDRGCKLSVNI